MIAWVRAGYGLALLIASDPLLRFVTGRLATTRRRAVVRVLAARELTQAVLTGRQPGAACLVVSAEVDLVHSVSMLCWAAIGNSRRLAVVSAVIAAFFAAGGVAQARRMSAAAGPKPAGQLAKIIELRNQVAAAITARTLPRMVRNWLCI